MESNEVSRCPERSTSHNHYREKVHGVGRSPWFHKQAEARDWASDARRDRRASAYPSTAATAQTAKTTFRVYTEQVYFTTRDLVQSSRDSYLDRLRRHVYPLIGDLPLGALTPHRLREVSMHLTNQVSRATGDVTWTIVASILKQAAGDGVWNGQSPARGIRSKDKRGPDQHILDPDDIPTATELWTCHDVASERLRALIRVATMTGLRGGELFGLWEDALDRDRRRIHVKRQLKSPNGGGRVVDLPKGRKTRWVEEVPDEVFDLLAEQRLKFASPVLTMELSLANGVTAPPPGPPIFTNRFGHPFARRNFDDTWKGIIVRAGIDPDGKKAHFHALRHVYATTLIEAGYPRTAIMRWLGHTDGNLLDQVYSHWWPSTEEVSDARRTAFQQRLTRPRHLKAVSDDN